MDRRVTPPRQVTSSTWAPPPPGKQALNDKVSYITSDGVWQATMVLYNWFRRFDFLVIVSLFHVSSITTPTLLRISHNV